MKNPMILMYNISEEKARKIRLAAMRYKIMVKAVSAQDQFLPVGSLCGLQAEEAQNEEAERFSGEMLVLAFMPQMLLNQFLQAIRKANAPVALKAMLTETNAQWTSAKLHREISSEHEALSVGNAPLHKA